VLLYNLVVNTVLSTFAQKDITEHTTV